MANGGYSFEDVVDAAEKNGRDCFASMIKDYIDEKVKLELCEIFGDKLSSLLAKSVQVVSPVRKINLLLIELDALLLDIENFEVLGLKVVPSAITAVPRAIVDELKGLYNDIDDFVNEVLDFFESLISDCERIRDGNIKNQ